MESLLQDMKTSSNIIAALEPSEKNRLLTKMADALRKNSKQIIDENQKDLTVGKNTGFKQKHNVLCL